LNDSGLMQDVVPGEPGHHILSRLINISSAEFATDYWGKSALLSAADTLPGTYEDLLSAAAVDELVSRRGLRTPFLRVAKAGTTLADKAFTGGGGVGAGIADQVSDDRLTRLFADGSTLVLQALHRTWPPIIEFCQNLAAVLGHPVQANAYVTPPQNQGFSDHYDVHDVFVLQIEGEKLWSIHAPVIEAPLRDQPWTDRRAAVERRAQEPPVIEAVLRPGDCLYLPRGFLHAATALGGISTHLTIGVHVWTRQALAEQLVQQAIRTVSNNALVRTSLPVGVSFSDASIRSDVDLVREALIQAIRDADVDQVEASLREASRDSQRAAPIGPLQQFRAAAELETTSAVLLRPHLAASLDHRGARVVLRSRAEDLDIDEDDVAPVKSLLSTGTAVAGDLGVDLARRLVLAGIAVVG
jgi:bifunctional lysine-specific demethylase and histidyl-hydroxylase NO66